MRQLLTFLYSVAWLSIQRTQFSKYSTDSNKILNDYLLAHALIVSKRDKNDYTKINAMLLMIKKKELNRNKNVKAYFTGNFSFNLRIWRAALSHVMNGYHSDYL